MATTWYKRIGRMHVYEPAMFSMLNLPADAAIRDATWYIDNPGMLLLTIEHDSLPLCEFGESLPIVQVKDGKLVMPYGV